MIHGKATPTPMPPARPPINAQGVQLLLSDNRQRNDNYRQRESIVDTTFDI